MWNPFKNFFKNKSLTATSPKSLGQFGTETVTAQSVPATYISKVVKAFPYDENRKHTTPLMVPIVVDGEIENYLPVAAIDNGDGTATLKSTVALGDVTLSPDVNVQKWGGTAQSGADLTPLFQLLSHLNVDLSTLATEATLLGIKTQTDKLTFDEANNLQVSGSFTLTPSGTQDVNIVTDSVGLSKETTLQSVKTDLDNIYTRLDVALSTRAAESTLASVKTDLDNILANIDVALSTRASESTLSSVKTDLDGILAKLDVALSTRASETTLSSLNSKDFATQATLAQVKTDLDNIYARLDVATSTRASEATLASVKTDLDSILANIDVALSTRASEATLLSAKTDLDNILTKLDVALSTRASESTLSALNGKVTTTANGIKVDGSAVTQPISATSLPLPTGASTEATLSSVKTDLDNILAKLDVALSTRASEATLSSLNSKDFATQTTLALVKTDLDSILAKLDVNLSTRASESTLSSVKTDLDEIATDTDKLDVNLSTRATELTLSSVKTDLDEIALDTDNLAGIKTDLDSINTKTPIQGQTTMSASSPVVLASDQSPVPVTISSDATRELGRVLASDLLIADDTFSTTLATFGNARPIAGDISVRHYKTKKIFVKNTSVNNGRVRITASVDNGANYDITLLADSALNAGITSISDFTDAVTHIRIEAHSQNGGQTTTWDSKGYALGI